LNGARFQKSIIDECFCDPVRDAACDDALRVERTALDAAKERKHFLQRKRWHLREAWEAPPWTAERQRNWDLKPSEAMKRTVGHCSDWKCQGCGREYDPHVRWLVGSRDFGWGAHHLSYWGVDPEHGDVYPILSSETPGDLQWLCPLCHDRMHRRGGGLTGDIDSLSWRAKGLERAYNRIVEAFRMRTPGEPFYLCMFGAKRPARGP
jgi:hypothetical protein